MVQSEAQHFERKLIGRLQILSDYLLTQYEENCRADHVPAIKKKPRQIRLMSIGESKNICSP